MVKTASLGFPRIGKENSLPGFFRACRDGRIPFDDFLTAQEAVFVESWQAQIEAGIDYIPVEAPYFYDQMLNMMYLLGVLPERFRPCESEADLFFAVTEGTSSVPPLEKDRWFATPYHACRPEFEERGRAAPVPATLVAACETVQSMGGNPRPVLIGPVSFMARGRSAYPSMTDADILARLLPAYETLLNALSEIGVSWVQMDEPILSDGPSDMMLSLARGVYARLGAFKKRPFLMVTPYYGALSPKALKTLYALPVEGVHIDFVEGEKHLYKALRLGAADTGKLFSCGLIAGRNVWQESLDMLFETLEEVTEFIPEERLIIAPSCPLYHLPYDKRGESYLPDAVVNALCFACQKIETLAILKKGIQRGHLEIRDVLADNRAMIRQRQQSDLIHVPAVKARVGLPGQGVLERTSPHALRQTLQETACLLPPYPVTLSHVDSFASAAHALPIAERDPAQTKEDIAAFIAHQENEGVDLLSVGLFEADDTLGYIATNLDGIAETEAGFIQIAGDICRRPLLLYGDVSRPSPFSLFFQNYAASLTDKPVKAVLPDPFYIAQAAFVRDDVPLEQALRQLACALRDEILDLEKSDVPIIQIETDYAPLSLMLTAREKEAFYQMRARIFRLLSCAVQDETQIYLTLKNADGCDYASLLLDWDVDKILLPQREGDALDDLCRNAPLPQIYILPIDEVGAEYARSGFGFFMPISAQDKEKVTKAKEIVKRLREEPFESEIR